MLQQHLQLAQFHALHAPGARGHAHADARGDADHGGALRLAQGAHPSFFHLRPDHRKLTLTDALRLIQDGGFERFFTERPSPRVTAKAVYYLSDQSEPGRGNTCEIYGTLSRFPRTRVTKASPLSRDRARLA